MCMFEFGACMCDARGYQSLTFLKFNSPNLLEPTPTCQQQDSNTGNFKVGLMRRFYHQELKEISMAEKYKSITK